MPLLRTLLLNGTLGLAGYWSARYGFRVPAGLPRALAAFTLAWAWAILGMEILGPPGYLSYGPLLAWTAAGLAIGLGLRWLSRGEGDAREEPIEQPQRWEAGAVVALGLILWVSLIHGLSALLGPVQVVSDGPIYHLYFAVRWWKAGRLFLVAAPFGEAVVTYFPAVGDLGFAWLLVGWDGDRLARVGQVPFLFVSSLAAFASARRLGAGTSSAVIATAWFVAAVPFLMFTFTPNVDTIFVAGYLVAAYFFLRYALGDERTAALVPGALAAGGVLGSKPTGFVFAAPLLGAAALAVLWRRTSIRQAVGHLALLALLPLVMAGYWYGRNFLLTGNPLYPLHLAVLGHVLLPGWYGADVMRMSPYYLPRGDWRALIDILCAVFDPRLLPFWTAALVGVWALGRRRMPLSLSRWAWAFSALAFVNLAMYWILVPYRTQQRFMLQSVGLLVVPLALLFDRGRWLRVLGAGLLALHLLTASGWPFVPAEAEPPWDLSPLIPNRVPPLLAIPGLSAWSRGASPDAGELSALAAMLAVAAGSIAVAWAWDRPGRGATARAAGATVALLALTTAFLYPYQASPRDQFFPRFPEYHTGWLQLDARAGPSGSRIAYAGTNLPYYLFGVNLRNDVHYINIDAQRGWLLHDYHRRAQSLGAPTWPNPWPTWDRQHPDYDAWLANLRAEGIQILVVASMGRPRGSLPDVDLAGFPIERRWAEAHPESFEPLYGVAEDDPHFRIYRVRPRIASSVRPRRA